MRFLVLAVAVSTDVKIDAVHLLCETLGQNEVKISPRLTGSAVTGSTCNCYYNDNCCCCCCYDVTGSAVVLVERRCARRSSKCMVCEAWTMQLDIGSPLATKSMGTSPQVVPLSFFVQTIQDTAYMNSWLLRFMAFYHMSLRCVEVLLLAQIGGCSVVVMNSLLWEIGGISLEYSQ